MKPLPKVRPVNGPILSYLRLLPDDLGKELQATIQAVLRTPDGHILLEVLEKATLELNFPPLADQRALDAANAQSFIASDLRRIADETEYADARKQANQSEHGRARQRDRE